MYIVFMREIDITVINVNRKSKRKSNHWGMYIVFMRERDITVFNVKRTSKCKSNFLGHV